MAAPTSLAANATKAQALAYLSANFKNTYHNAAKTPYEGKNASQLYAQIEAQNPKAPPHDIAVAVADLLLSSGIGSAVGTGTNEGFGAISDFAQAAGNSANYLPSLTSLLSALTSANTWIRVAKVVVGGALVLIGVAHMTGASGAVSTVARKVPLPV
jgi:hypothetical protein